MTEALISKSSIDILGEYLKAMKTHEQTKLFNAVSSFVTSRYLQSEIESKDASSIPPSPRISAVAGLLNGLLKDNEKLQDHVVAGLAQKSSARAPDDALAARRAAIAAIAQYEGE